MGKSESGYYVSAEDIRNVIKAAVVNEVIDEQQAGTLRELILYHQEHLEVK